MKGYGLVTTTLQKLKQMEVITITQRQSLLGCLVYSLGSELLGLGRWQTVASTVGLAFRQGLDDEVRLSFFRSDVEGGPWLQHGEEELSQDDGGQAAEEEEAIEEGEV